jgi:hypothetical protein
MEATQLAEKWFGTPVTPGSRVRVPSLPPKEALQIGEFCLYAAADLLETDGPPDWATFPVRATEERES